MIHFDAWKRMGLVERQNYEANVGQFKRVAVWCAFALAFVIVVTGLFVWTLSEGIIG